MGRYTPQDVGVQCQLVGRSKYVRRSSTSPAWTSCYRHLAAMYGHETRDEQAGEQATATSPATTRVAQAPPPQIAGASTATAATSDCLRIKIIGQTQGMNDKGARGIGGWSAEMNRQCLQKKVAAEHKLNGGMANLNGRIQGLEALLQAAAASQAASMAQLQVQLQASRAWSSGARPHAPLQPMGQQTLGASWDLDAWFSLAHNSDSGRCSTFPSASHQTTRSRPSCADRPRSWPRTSTPMPPKVRPLGDGHGD